jgi:hypothetical protein
MKELQSNTGMARLIEPFPNGKKYVLPSLAGNFAGQVNLLALVCRSPGANLKWPGCGCQFCKIL